MVAIADSKVRPLSRKDRLRARAMYLQGDAPPREIAERLGCDPKQISNLVGREGWGKLRRSAEQKAQLAVSRASANLADAAQECIDASIIRLPSVIEHGFDLADRASDGKEFGMAMGGACKGLTTLRTIAGLDAQPAAQLVRVDTLNVICGDPFPEAKADPVNVTATAAAEAFEFA